MIGYNCRSILPLVFWTTAVPENEVNVAGMCFQMLNSGRFVVMNPPNTDIIKRNRPREADSMKGCQIKISLSVDRSDQLTLQQLRCMKLTRNGWKIVFFVFQNKKKKYFYSLNSSKITQGF